MSNVTKKETNQLSFPMESWGTEGVDSKDILIAKILVAQGLSEAVTNEKVKLGDIYDSVENKVLGNAKTGIKFIPLMSFKTWVRFEKKGSKLEYRGTEPVDAHNKNLPWETDSERNDECINYYVMLESEMTKPDAMPYLISFRRTSYQAGKKLETFKLRSAQAKKPLAMTTFILKSEKKENDDGVFYVFDVEHSGETNKEYVGKAYEWYKTLQQNKHKVDESDVEVKAAPKTKQTDVQPGAMY